MSTGTNSIAGCVGDGITTFVTLSVIIPSYNARELLANYLESIYRNPSSEPYEIIVVDDASIDGTSEMVRRRFHKVISQRS
jgi:glycosyltransferase involved in cell wall biosynthesis